MIRLRTQRLVVHVKLETLFQTNFILFEGILEASFSELIRTW